ncbi:MAG: nucleoside 2-deoxyribosyltransferase [Moraxellaceae bacterium]
MSTQRIYCSGPLFCPEEVGGMTAIANVLEGAGYKTFLPHRDGLEGYVMRFGNISVPAVTTAIRTRIDQAIFALDVYELLERCDAVVCNLNGRVPDEGMIVEAALAYAAGKPLVLYKDDIRSPFGGHDNAMLTALSQGRIINHLGELPDAVTRGLAGSARQPAPLSLELQKAIAYGKRLSLTLSHLPETAGKKQWSQAVIDRVLDEATREK